MSWLELKVKLRIVIFRSCNQHRPALLHTGKVGPRTLRWDPGPRALGWDPKEGH